MITIFRVFPAELNLNGDAENAQVISKRLEWAGIRHRLVDVTSETEIDACRLEIEESPTRCVVVIGHGSKAACASLSTHVESLRSLFNRMVELGTPGIVVASGLDLVGRGSSNLGELSSRPYKVKMDIPEWPKQAIGYFNSRSKNPVLVVESNVILTYLHGPFLARNQDWATALISRTGVELTTSDQEQVAKGHVDKIWEMPDD